MKSHRNFWIVTLLIWLFSTWIDRTWWHQFDGLPAWDQAEYLNSALEHGRALGILSGGEWEGWKALLDHSPKIPPLASFINGSVIAIAGEEPQQAAWSLSLWNGILLASVAGWGLYLSGEVLGILGVLLIAFAPALIAIRLNYLLEMPLTAVVTFSLWRLGCWWNSDQDSKKQWQQLFIASVACTSAILIKQSSLLVLLPCFTWVCAMSLRKNQAMILQLCAGISIVLLGILPWLRHNLITTLSGTNRAVIQSAVKEGDPTLFSIENWVWYPRLLPEQIGLVVFLIGCSGLVLWLLMKYRRQSRYKGINQVIDNQKGWQWLIFSLLAGFILTSISPNKDARYITPLLPPLLLLLARGWLQWGLWASNSFPLLSQRKLLLALLTGLTTIIPTTWNAHKSLLGTAHEGPLLEIINTIKNNDDNKEKRKTVIVVPSTPDLNQHNFSYYGRIKGGNLVGRQLGNSLDDIQPVLNQSQWVILAEGDQGSVRNSSRSLDKAIRNSQVFEELKQFPRQQGGSYSIWHRRHNKPTKNNFSTRFPVLARQLGEGIDGIEEVFREIAIQHMIDAHFGYQEKVQEIAIKRISNNPNDINSRWALALLAVLRNRASEAEIQFAVLEKLLPTNPWPSIYRSTMALAEWNPWKAASIADSAKQLHVNNAVLEGLGDLSGILGGGLWRLPAATNSIPRAITQFNTK